MHWLKYTWRKIRIEQNPTLRSSFFHAVSTRIIVFVSFTDHFVPLLLESAVSLSFGQLFILIGTFLDIAG